MISCKCLLSSVLKQNRQSSLPPRDALLVTRLWLAKTYPIPLTKTKRFCSFINYALSNYNNSHVFLYTVYKSVFYFYVFIVSHCICSVKCVSRVF